MEAALHVNNASGHTLADAVRGAPPETHSSEGGGVWAEYLPKAALTSNDLFLDDANVLVPVWLGGRGDRPAFPIGRNRIFALSDDRGAGAVRGRRVTFARGVCVRVRARKACACARARAR